MDFLLPIWNPFIVHPLEQGLRLLATPLEGAVGPGAAGGLAIVLFTILLRLVLVPLSLVQIRSQRHQMAIQPELKVLQRKFKGDREGMARAQMQLYKERGINPAAGCVPLLIQLPILFGMYSAMSQLATMGLTLDQVSQSQIQAGQVVYAAERHQDPLPFNQFVLARVHAVPQVNSAITIDVNQDQSGVWHQGQPLLQAVQGLTLTPGQSPGNPNPPNTPNGSSASIFLRAGVLDSSGIVERNTAVAVGEPVLVEIWVNAAGVNADQAKAVLTYDPTQLQVTSVETPQLEDIAFKSPFLWLPSLGQPDVVHIPGLPFTIPGLLLIVMTITSYVSQRMTTMPTEDPQQQAMMRSMAFMPLMYLFFFLNTPAGLVLYWLTSNVFSMFQQYFTVGLGLLGGDLQKVTGRDLQPPWAHLPGSVPIAALSSDATNGTNHTDGRTPGSGSGATGGARRSRSGNQGRGRKRGKR
ncbi:MAG TPA: YidC/Oxa1 family membrane protein insertase [Chloroflexota bacterium]|nr:YidC/Oxa1 family membrane protein insertase [Chloroflexota bacterium]